MNAAVIDRQLDILYERSCDLAERVAAGSLTLVDAVDMAQSAAELAGVVENAGPDVVQAVLAQAFVGAAP